MRFFSALLLLLISVNSKAQEQEYFPNPDPAILGNGAKLKWKKTGDGVEVNIPEKLKSATDHVWVIKAAE